MVHALPLHHPWQLIALFLPHEQDVSIHAKLLTSFTHHLGSNPWPNLKFGSGTMKYNIADEIERLKGNGILYSYTVDPR